MQKDSAPSRRIEALDYLRGFFILVIIVDHLWRWPNLFQYASGRGELWASAAEGFIIISGLLVGYVRGRKSLKKPLSEVSKKLVLRGIMLYIWVIITTIILVVASWYLPFASNIAFVPYDKGDLLGLLSGTVTLQFAHSLTHFLYLYAIFLVVAPVFVWLFRRGMWWLGVLLSMVGWAYGFALNIEYLQWQALFFLAAAGGFYLDQIIAVGRKIPERFVWLAVFCAMISIVVAEAIILPSSPGSYSHEVFTREPLSLPRIGLALTWFVALAWLFNLLEPWLHKFVGWILLPFGTRSLTAYILHSFVLMLVSLAIPNTYEFWLNTLIAVIAIMGTWAVLKIPNINRVVPR